MLGEGIGTELAIVGEKEIFGVKMARVEFRVQRREDAAHHCLAENERTADDECLAVDVLRNEWTDADAREFGQENQVMVAEDERFYAS